MNSEDLTTGELAAFPRFSIPVRPTSVPEALLALNRDTKVWYEHGTSCGISGSGLANAGSIVQEYEERIGRQGRDQFHPDEAAHLVAEAQRFQSRAFRKSMEKAFRSGVLRVRAPDTEAPRDSLDAWRPASDIVTVGDLNAWLEDEGMSYRFPAGEVPESDSPRHVRRAEAPSRSRRNKPSSGADVAATSKAADARWNHLELFKAKALQVAKSKAFPSCAAAAREAALQLDPKPKPKSKPDAEDQYYPPSTIEKWLKEAGWTSV